MRGYMQRNIFNVLAILLCLILLWAQTPTARQVWLDWNHQFRWAVMVEVFYQRILPVVSLLFGFLFWKLRKEYRIRWPVLVFLLVLFPVIVSGWQRGVLTIDLPELSFALVLVIIGLFFKIGKWLSVGVVALLGTSLELVELLYPQVRFFEWKDLGINLISILFGYYLIKYIRGGNHGDEQRR